MTAKRYNLTRARTIDFLDVLDRTGERAVTIHLPQGIPRDELGMYLQQLHLTPDLTGELAKSIAAARTGAVIFWGESHRRFVVPPFPQCEKYVTGGYETGPLRLALTRDHRIGIVLVRLGSFSVGVCQGERLIAHKTGSGLVHGRQRQGGSSAARFRRRREGQIHHFLERVAGHAEEVLTPLVKTLDYVVYGGARTTIQELLKHSRFLQQFEDRLLPPLLAISEPRYGVLQRTVAEVWSSHVTEWREETAGSA